MAGGINAHIVALSSLAASSAIFSPGDLLTHVGYDSKEYSGGRVEIAGKETGSCSCIHDK